MARSKAVRRTIGYSGLGLGVGCAIAIIQGVHTPTSVVVLGILGTAFFFSSALQLGWHKARLPIGTVVRTCILFTVSVGVMITVCIFEWPKSDEQMDKEIREKVEEQKEAIANAVRFETKVHPCSGEKLSACSDEQLYQWASALVIRIKKTGRLISLLG